MVPKEILNQRFQLFNEAYIFEDNNTWKQIEIDNTPTTQKCVQLLYMLKTIITRLAHESEHKEDK